MSKKSKQELLRKRLDNLFSEIVFEQGLIIPAISAHTNNTGWVWRCDSDGIYTDCGPEIEAILDFKPEEVIGNQITEFALESKSRSLLIDALRAKKYPAELVLQFRTKQDEIIDIAFYIITEDTEHDQRGELRGFAQVQQAMDIPADAPVFSPQNGQHFNPAPGRAEQTTATLSLESAPLAYRDTESLDPSAAIGYLGSKTVGEKINHTPILLEPTKLELLDIIDSDPDREWSEDELLLVEQVADQLSLALENAKLFNQTQDALSETDEQARRLRLLNEMSALLSKVTSLQEILDVTSRYIDRILKTDLSSISILNDSGNYFEVYELHSEKGAVSVEAQMPMEETSIGKVMTENRLINNRNLEKETHLTDSKKLLDQGILSTLIAPLTVSGKTFGTLNVGSSQTDFFSKNDENLITNISTIISSTAENQQLFDAVQGALADSEEQGRRLKLLNKMSDQLSRAENMVEIGNIATSKTLDILQGSRASMLQINPGDKTAEVVAVAGEIPETPTGTRVDLIGPLNTAVEDKRVVINEDSEEGDLTSLRSTMVAPILSGGKVICVLNIDADKNFFYTAADENVITQITSLVASVLENKRLFSQIQLRSAQLQTSAQVSRLASGILDSADLLQQVVEEIREGFGLYYTGLFMVDSEGDWTGEPGRWAVLQAGTGEPGRQMLAAGHKLELGGESMIGSAIAEGDAKIALDVGEEAVFFRNPYLPNTRSEIALPLIARGVTLGALSIQSDQAAAFSQEDITALQTMTDQVANSIENVNLFEQTQERAEELGILNEMARSFTQTLEIDDIHENIYLYTSRLMDARNFYIATYDKELDEIHIPLFKYHGETHEDQGIRRTSGNGITEWIIRNQKPLLIRDNATEWIEEHGLEMRGYEAKSWLGVPMLKGSEVAGVIAVQSYSDNRKYSTHHLDLLSAVASQAGIAIENSKLFKETQARALSEQERAEQERLVRRITENVRSGEDIESILRITLEEIGAALGASKSILKLGTRENLLSAAPASNGIETEKDPT